MSVHNRRRHYRARRAARRRQEIAVALGGLAQHCLDVIGRVEVVEPDIARLVEQAGLGYREGLLRL